MSGISPCFQFGRSWQVQPQFRQAQVVHIALHVRLQRDRRCRQSVQVFRVHIALPQTRHVLLSHSGIHMEPAMSALPGSERAEVEVHLGIHLRVGRSEAQGRQYQARGVHVNGALQPVNGQSAFFFQGQPPQSGTQHPLVGKRQRVECQLQVRHRQVVGIQPLGRFLVGQVVAQPRLAQAEAAHGIVAQPRVEMSAAQGRRAYFRSDAHGVAGQAQGHLAAHNVSLLHVDNPACGACGRVLLRRVAQHDEEISILQCHAVQVYPFLFPVDAMGCGCQLFGVSHDARVSHVTLRVQFHVVQLHAVHFGTSFQQGQELHIQPQCACLQQRVALFGGQYIVNCQIKGKGQPHLTDAEVDPHTFRHGFGHPLYHEILDGRHINQDGQQQEQAYRRKQNDTNPLENSSVSLFHRCKCN